MKNINTLLALAGIAAALGFGTGQLAAQEPQGRGDRGNFDPEEFRQRAMDRYREQLEVKSDDEWTVVQGRIEKVLEARRAVGGPGGGRGFGGFGRRGGGGNAGGDNADRGGRRGGRGGGEPNPEADALQAALDAKASSDEIKAALAKYRESRKAKEATLAKAQGDLRGVLSVRQEATAVMVGLLP